MEPKVYCYNGKKFRVLQVDGEIFFHSYDIALILGFSGVTEMLHSTPYLILKNFSTQVDDSMPVDMAYLDIQQILQVINTAVDRDKLGEAKEFYIWIHSIVFPEMRYATKQNSQTSDTSDKDFNIHKAEMLLECIKLCRRGLSKDMLRVFAHEFLHLLIGRDTFNPMAGTQA